MRSKWISALGLALLAGVVLYVGSSCLSLDTDRSCGEGEPPCYQGEVCFEGRCYDQGSLPERYGDVGPRDGSDDDTDENGTDDTQPVDAPRDAGETSRPDTATDSSDADLDTATSTDLGPDGSHCRQLETYVDGGNLGGLEDLWNRSPDAGPLPEHPGSSCNTGSECTGECEDRTCVHRVFTTSERYPADFGGLRQADCICQLLAQKAGRDGVYRAILSGGGTTMKERLAFRAAWYVMDYENGSWGSTELFPKTADFFDRGPDPGEKPIYTEDGQPLEYVQGKLRTAWTGWDRTTGGVTHSCENWSTTSGEQRGHVGKLRAESQNWFSADKPHCNQQSDFGVAKRHLYCIEQ